MATNSLTNRCELSETAKGASKGRSTAESASLEVGGIVNHSFRFLKREANQSRSNEGFASRLQPMRGLLLALAGQILLSAAPLLAQPQPSTGQLLPGLIQAKPPLQVFQPRQPDNKFDPAFPVTIEAPMLIRCPTGVTVRLFDGASPEPLSRIQARINSAISLVCTYGYVGQLTVGGFGSDNACPAEVLAGVVGGPDLGKTTSTGDGCNMGNA